MSIWLILAAWLAFAVILALGFGRMVRMRDRVKDPRDR